MWFGGEAFLRALAPLDQPHVLQGEIGWGNSPLTFPGVLGVDVVAVKSGLRTGHLKPWPFGRVQGLSFANLSFPGEEQELKKSLLVW